MNTYIDTSIKNLYYRLNTFIILLWMENAKSVMRLTNTVVPNKANKKIEFAGYELLKRKSFFFPRISYIFFA